MLQNRIIAVAVLGLAALPISAQAAVILDDFNATNIVWPVSLPKDSMVENGSDLGPVGVIGPGRYFRMDYSDFPNPNRGLLTAELSVSTTPAGAGVLDFATPSDRTAVLDLYYFPPAGALTNLVSISVLVLQYDGPGNAPMSVTVLLDGVSYAPAASVPAGGPTLVTFDLNAVPANIKSTVSNIDVIFTPPTGGDFRLDEITALVPEPATALAFGATCLMLRRRRQSR